MPSHVSFHPDHRPLPCLSPLPYPFFQPTISHISRPHQPIKQRPSKHKATQPTKHLTHPHIPQRSIKVLPRRRLRLERKQQYRDEQRACEVEDEAWVRLEAQRAGGDAEERGGQIADVGYDL